VSETPAYPRPNEERIRDAMIALFTVLEYFPPPFMIEDSLLVRALLAKGFTTSQSIWAIHDVSKHGGFTPIIITRHPRDGGNHSFLVTEDDPPAGLDIAAGNLDYGLESIRGWWGTMAFLPEPIKLDELRTSMNFGNSVLGKLSRRNAELPASAANLFIGSVPKNSNLVDLIVLLDSQKDSGRSMNEIAAEFMGGDTKKSKSLLSQIRRMKREGRLRP